MSKAVLVFLFFSICLFAGKVRIAMAANLSYSMPELKSAFAKSHPDIKIEETVGGSGKLASQIINGAPYDIFISANMDYPQKLYAQRLATTRPKIYAQGVLVMLSRKKRDFAKGLSLLDDAEINKIAIANPRTAPYGKAAMEALQNSALFPKVHNKLVYGESISQTVAYSIGAADIGIVSKSALFAPQMTGFKKGENWIEVDKSLYKPIDQGMVLVGKDQPDKEAKEFYDFLLSPQGQKILTKYGYTTP